MGSSIHNIMVWKSLVLVQGANVYFPILDINECEGTPSVCGAASVCTNTDGSHSCACVDGFEMVDGSCIGE